MLLWLWLTNCHKYVIHRHSLSLSAMPCSPPRLFPPISPTIVIMDEIMYSGHVTPAKVMVILRQPNKHHRHTHTHIAGSSRSYAMRGLALLCSWLSFVGRLGTKQPNNAISQIPVKIWRRGTFLSTNVIWVWNSISLTGGSIKRILCGL